MARKKKPDASSSEPRPAGRAAIGQQVNVRIPPDLLDDLELIKKGMGLESLSSVVRMILTEHREEYVDRVLQRAKKSQEDE